LLSFPTNLANELRDRHASAYWYIKLYYGDESNFTGLSDQDRLLSAVKYRGLVLDWGSIIHSVDLPSFTASTLAMNGLRISNADDKIAGGRFSDLFNTQNYVNRKFTLHMGAVGVAVGDHAQIAQGIITDQMTQDFDSITISLTEDLSSVQVEVPTSRVDAATYTNAPENNIGKPIPMAWGDCGLQTNIGTIPTGGAEFDRYFVKGYFPAIITDRWSDTGAYIEARPDQTGATLNSLNIKRVYYYGDDKYSPCEDSNVTASAATPLVTFKGATWRSYFTLSAWDTFDAGDYANMIDNDFSTSFTLAVDVTNTAVTGFRIPKIPKLGEFTSIKVMFDFGAFGGTAPTTSGVAYTYAFQVQGASSDYQITWNGGDQSIDITADYSTANKDAWDFEQDFNVVIDDTGGIGAQDSTVVINQVGLEVEFTPSQNFVKSYFTEKVFNQRRLISDDVNSDRDRGTIRVATQLITPEVSDYIYYSGKGREFGSWIDTLDAKARATFTGVTDPGYNSGALIENPVYIIEDILRTELGLDPSDTGIDIDVVTFDTVGNTTDGTLGDVFTGTAVTNILYAFSQMVFMSGWTLCRELAAGCGCLLFLSGDGKIKITPRLLDYDYTTSDVTLSYDDLKNIKPGITPIASVRNQVTVNYNYDYGEDVLKGITSVVSDATSKGSGANGINATQELIYDNRFIIDSNTATIFSEMLLYWLAYRKKILSFGLSSAEYNDLEIGDTIKFSDWPSTFKIYGNTITATDIYMVTKIQKYPNGCSISCQEVSEVTD